MNPRNDQVALDRLCAERECSGPEWWVCADRGCYEDAKRNYADGAIKRDQVRGYPETTVRNDGNDFLRTAHGRKWR